MIKKIYVLKFFVKNDLKGWTLGRRRCSKRKFSKLCFYLFLNINMIQCGSEISRPWKKNWPFLKIQLLPKWAYVIYYVSLSNINTNFWINTQTFEISALLFIIFTLFYSYHCNKKPLAINYFKNLLSERIYLRV